MDSELSRSTSEPLPANSPKDVLSAPLHEPSRRQQAEENTFHPWALLVVAGVLSGALAAGLGEEFHGYVSAELKQVELQGNKTMQPTQETRIAATLKNGAIDNAELGALMGLALGLAGGLARRSLGASVGAGLLGLVLGTVVGAVTPLGVFPLFYAAKQHSATTEPDLVISMVMHAGIWASLGAVGGLAYAIGLGGRGRLGRAVIGGFLGAFVATILYEVIGAVQFPLAGTGEPIADTWPPRVLARLLVPILSALAIGKLALTPMKSRP